MRALLLPAVAGLLFAASVSPVPPRPAPAGPPPPDPVERGLKLVAEPDFRRPPAVGVIPFVPLVLVNTSRHTSYRVVHPGHESGSGRRGFHIFLTWSGAPADQAHGRGEPDYGGWELFDKWDDPAMRPRVVMLAPGGRLPVGRPSAHFSLDQPGRAELVAHYKFTGGSALPPELSRMGGVPPFELVSDPIEVEVVRPFEVRLRVKRGVKAHEKLRLSDLFEVDMANPAAAPFALGPVYDFDKPQLWFQYDFGHRSWLPQVESRDRHPGLVRLVPAGGSVPLIGPDRFDGDWVYPWAETLRLRAVYTEGGDNKRVEVKSEWVEVRVGP